MSSWFPRCLSIAAFCLVPVAEAQFGGAPAELDLIRVRDDVYVIHNAFVPGNVTALITDQGVLLIDTKFAIDYESVSAMLSSVTDQPVRYVVNTHYHDDHSGANQLLQLGGAMVIASDSARRKMLNAGREAGLPDVTFADATQIYVGDVAVNLYYFGRAHTDGDIVAHLPEHGILVAGDIYANDPGTPELVDYAGGGSAREWPRTLARALELDFDTVIPGHGTVAPRADLSAFRDETARLAEMVQAMIRQGAQRSAIEAMLRSEFNFADFHVQSSLDGLLVELQ
jgi:glyoxylase-like metal-dependent hydrolase (beta-lactamase superfamily II)